VGIVRSQTKCHGVCFGEESSTSLFSLKSYLNDKARQLQAVCLLPVSSVSSYDEFGEQPISPKHLSLSTRLHGSTEGYRYFWNVQINHFSRLHSPEDSHACLSDQWYNTYTYYIKKDFLSLWLRYMNITIIISYILEHNIWKTIFCFNIQVFPVSRAR
jgi:hypothetical protein